MNNKCINLRVRSKKGIKYGYCVKFKKEVSIFCKCKNIEYKQYKSITNRTTKQSKLDKSRTVSLFTDNLNVCYLCGSKKTIFTRCFTGEIEVILLNMGYLYQYVKSAIESAIMILI